MIVSGDPTRPKPPTITVLPGPTRAAASSTEMTLLFTRPLDRPSMRGTSAIPRDLLSSLLRILSVRDKYVQYFLLTNLYTFDIRNR